MRPSFDLTDRPWVAVIDHPGATHTPGLAHPLRRARAPRRCHRLPREGSLPFGQRFAAGELKIRVDRPAWPLEDFHTVGGLPPDTTGPTVEGHCPAGEATITSRRDLADAAFTLAPETPEGLSTKAAQTLRAPVWSPWLGRRAGVPTEPLPPAANLPDAAGLLPTSVRLTRRRPPHAQGTISVDSADQQATLHGAGAPPAPPTQLVCVPVSFVPTRHHTTRGGWGAVGQRPAAVRVGYRATTQQAGFRGRHHPGAPAWPSG